MSKGTVNSNPSEVDRSRIPQYKVVLGPVSSVKPGDWRLRTIERHYGNRFEEVAVFNLQRDEWTDRHQLELKACLDALHALEQPTSYL